MTGARLGLCWDETGNPGDLRERVPSRSTARLKGRTPAPRRQQPSIQSSVLPCSPGGMRQAAPPPSLKPSARTAPHLGLVRQATALKVLDDVVHDRLGDAREDGLKVVLCGREGGTGSSRARARVSTPSAAISVHQGAGARSGTGAGRRGARLHVLCCLEDMHRWKVQVRISMATQRMLKWAKAELLRLAQGLAACDGGGAMSLLASLWGRHTGTCGYLTQRTAWRGCIDALSCVCEPMAGSSAPRRKCWRGGRCVVRAPGSGSGPSGALISCAVSINHLVSGALCF